MSSHPEGKGPTGYSSLREYCSVNMGVQLDYTILNYFFICIPIYDCFNAFKKRSILQLFTLKNQLLKIDQIINNYE